MTMSVAQELREMTPAQRQRARAAIERAVAEADRLMAPSESPERPRVGPELWRRRKSRGRWWWVRIASILGLLILITGLVLRLYVTNDAWLVTVCLTVGAVVNVLNLWEIRRDRRDHA